jgi:hypothetical protein
MMMEETRIDRLEVRFDELAAEMRSGFREVDARLCKIDVRLCKMESSLSQLQTVMATKSDLNELRNELRIEMYKNNAEMKTWLLATMITINSLFFLALFGLRHWGP